MRIARRGLLLAAVGIAGCAADPGGGGPDPAAHSGAGGSAAPTGEHGRQPGGPVPGSDQGSSSAVSRDQIVAQYGSEQPSSFGMTVQGVVQRLNRTDAFALTFDACGGPRPSSPGMACDLDLIAVLREFKVPATLFLNSRWIAGNRAFAGELAADPLFELANHGTHHVPLTVVQRSAYEIVGTSGAGEVHDELMGCQHELTAITGRAPSFFRAGTAHVDDVAVKVAGRLGLRVVNFSVNSDAGATYPAAEVRNQLAGVRGGDIVIGHMNRPPGGTAGGLRAAMRKLLSSGLTPIQLSAGL